MMEATWFKRVPALAVLLLVGLGARLLALDVQPLWWDEGYSMYFATESPWRLIELTSLDIHPPLYYLLLQGWLAAVGIGSMQARLLSVLIGTVTLPLAWWTARPLAGKRAAWVSTLLLAVSPLHIYYSQEVRMYGLVVLLALLAVGFWQRGRWWPLGIVIAAGLLTHYYFAFLAIAIALLIWLDWRSGHCTMAGPLRALAVVVVGFLPWALYAGPRLLSYVGNKLVIEGDRPMTPLEFLPRHLVAWSTGHPTSGWEWIGAGSILFIALAMLSTAKLFRTPEQNNALARLRSYPLLWLIALPVVGAFLVGISAPFIDSRIERQLLYVHPFFLMAVASGYGFLWRRWSVAALPLLLGLLATSLVALWGFYTVPRYSAEDYRPLLARVGAEQGPGDGWLAVYPWQIGYLRAYLPGRHPTPLQANLDWDDDSSSLDAGVASLLRSHSRLWFPAYQVKGRLFEERIWNSLRAQGVEAWNEWYGNSRLFLIGSAPAPPALQPLGEFEGIGEVRGAFAGSELPSGVGILPVFIELSPDIENIRVSLQLTGGREVWGEWDGMPEDGLVRAGLPVAHGTPPGSYTVQFALYHIGSNEPLDRFQNGERLSPEGQIGTITIGRPTAPLPAASVRELTDGTEPVLLGETVRFLGAASATGSFLQGEEVPLTLFWQAARETDQELVVFVQAVGNEGVIRAARESMPSNGTFPTSSWQAGDLVRDPHRLQLPADMPPGQYELRAGMYEPGSGSRLVADSGLDFVRLGIIQVTERARQMDEPQVGDRVDASFGERVRLARVQGANSAESGTSDRVTLVWQAQQSGGSPLRVFVQLYRNGFQVQSSDHVPDPPATAWISGEWIVDEHTLPALQQQTAGEYHLIAGLVDPATKLRLPTAEGDWFTIATWTVEE